MSDEPIADPNTAADPGEQGSNDLNPRDESMAHLLGAGFTHAEVSRALDISTKTVQRRLQDEQFRSYVAQIRGEHLSAVTARLVAMGQDAVDAIRQVLASDNETLRFRAAESVLRLGKQHHREEVMDTELRARLDAVEEALDHDPRGL